MDKLALELKKTSFSVWTMIIKPLMQILLQRTITEIEKLAQKRIFNPWSLIKHFSLSKSLSLLKRHKLWEVPVWRNLLHSLLQTLFEERLFDKPRKCLCWQPCLMLSVSITCQLHFKWYWPHTSLTFSCLERVPSRSLNQMHPHEDRCVNLQVQ